MPHTRTTGLILLAALSAPVAIPAWAAPIMFSQMPTGSTWREPAPNVILTIDDSGSMASDLRGCPTAEWHSVSQNLNPLTEVQGCSKPAQNLRPSRLKVLRKTLLNTFGDPTANPPRPGLIIDSSIRLAWQAMHDNGNSIAKHGASRLQPGALNSMRSFADSHRQHFHQFVLGLAPQKYTPSHAMMRNAYTYMRSPAGLHSPWADVPGVDQSTPYSACRRSYHIFMTDGGWTGNGAASPTDPTRINESGDGTYRTLGDRRHVYDVDSDQTNPYRDSYDRPNTKNLSDLAFASWARDLQDGQGGTQDMANLVRPLIRHAGPETFQTPSCSSQGQAGERCVALEEFWNPRNDPATWQHLTQYTIGFGAEATTWPQHGIEPPLWDTLTDDNYGAEFALLTNGKRRWADLRHAPDKRPSDLWHMALNGRGKYFPARSAETLTTAFREILGDILVNNSARLVSSAINSNYLRAGQQIFQAGFESTRFSGTLIARPVDPVSGAVSASVSWDAAKMLERVDVQKRFIFSSYKHYAMSWSDYTHLPSSHRTALGTSARKEPDSLGLNRWRYLRGDRSEENAAGGPFRDRHSRLGDIVHSTVWYTGRPAGGYNDPDYEIYRSTTSQGKGGRTPMLYVGANDGMLHGFAATPGGTASSGAGSVPAGQELMAYIPAYFAANHLRVLTDPDYTHRYFVDGAIFTGDAKLGAPARWATVLVGTLGAGGRGYFVLDVSDPAKFQDAHVETLGVIDTTDFTTLAGQDPDLGYMFSPAVVDDSADNRSRQIVKMNNGRWAVLLGNGYNSTNEAPVLLVQYLDGDRSSFKLSPCAMPILSQDCAFKGNNGLSAPQPIDLNGDGTADVAYAGDLLGHLWKFDISTIDSAQWRVAFNDKPFFTAPPRDHVAQAISAAPLWRRHPLGGIMLAFGTGRDLSLTDPFSSGTDSLYALYDNSAIAASGNTVKLSDTDPINQPTQAQLPDTLVRQSTGTSAHSEGTSLYYQSSTHAVNYLGNPKAVPPVAAHRGWTMDLPFPGQRMLQSPRAFSGEKVAFQSLIPSIHQGPQEDSCKPTLHGARWFLSILNLFTGKPASSCPFYLNTQTQDPLAALRTSMLEGTDGGSNMVHTATQIKWIPSNCPPGETCAATSFQPGHFTGVRAGWHQVQ